MSCSPTIPTWSRRSWSTRIASSSSTIGCGRRARTLGHGLLTSEGEFWRGQRKLAQPAFHRERIANYARLMVDYTERMLESWTDGQVRDVQADMMRLTLEIVAKTLFDAEIGGETGRRQRGDGDLDARLHCTDRQPGYSAALGSHAAESPHRAGHTPAGTHPHDGHRPSGAPAARTGAICCRCCSTPRMRRAAVR